MRARRSTPARPSVARNRWRSCRGSAWLIAPLGTNETNALHYAPPPLGRQGRARRRGPRRKARRGAGRRCRRAGGREGDERVAEEVGIGTGLHVEGHEGARRGGERLVVAEKEALGVCRLAE